MGGSNNIFSLIFGNRLLFALPNQLLKYSIMFQVPFPSFRPVGLLSMERLPTRKTIEVG